MQAYLNETGLRFGNRRWSADEIRVMLESLDVWTLPCANPDGREYCQTVDDLWRKNRRDHPDTPDDKDGVDTNRNSDIVWGVTNPNTSCFPASIQYCGTARFSEPESLNIKAFCDAHRVNVYLDVHSYSQLVDVSVGSHAHPDQRPDQTLHEPRDRNVCAARTPPAIRNT